LQTVPLVHSGTRPTDIFIHYNYGKLEKCRQDGKA
jgi:hypothetical protein